MKTTAELDDHHGYLIVRYECPVSRSDVSRDFRRWLAGELGRRVESLMQLSESGHNWIYPRKEPRSPLRFRVAPCNPKSKCYYHYEWEIDATTKEAEPYLQGYKEYLEFVASLEETSAPQQTAST